MLLGLSLFQGQKMTDLLGVRSVAPAQRKASFDFASDQRVDFEDDVGKDALIVRKQQEIPSEFMDRLADSRLETSNSRFGNFARVASIPIAIYDKWMKQGYDIAKEPVQKTIAKLKAESLENFLATNKRFGK